MERPDCAFVISTHDLNLPLDNEGSSVLMLRGCEWDKKKPKGWDADYLESISDNKNIDYEVKRQILGSKRNILFVEGNDGSLDKQIYQLLYPSISVIPKGNCVEVERSVLGMKTAENLHWLNAIGLVDADDRTPEEIDKLKQHSVYALPCYSVESLYYHEKIIEAVAKRMSEVTGKNSKDMFDNAMNAIKTSVIPHKDRLCARLCEKKVRAKVMLMLPKHKDLISDKPLKIEVDTKSILEEEKNQFDRLIDLNSINSIINRYPLRETPALDRVAENLELKNRQGYEDSVRKLLVDSEESKNLLRYLLSDLTSKIDELKQQ